MNPEFRRNLWLELTPVRLGVVLFALVALLAMAYVVSSPPHHFVATIGRWSFFVLVMLWGGRLAADSVVHEINERTWDSQRLSSLGPWAMSWGKLFGAPAAAWIAGLVALAMVLVADPDYGLADALRLVLIGLLCHATALAMSLQSIRKGRQPGRVKTFLFQLIGLGAAWLAYLPTYTSWMMGSGPGRVGWFGLSVPASQFGLATLGLYTLWAVVAVYRLMRLELQKPSTPIAWAAFMAFLIVYGTGLALGGNAALADFSGRLQHALQSAAPSVAALCAYAIMLAFSYVAVFTEPKDPVALGQFVAAARQGRWRRAWSLMPRWLVSLAFALLTLLAALLALHRYGLDFETATVSDGLLVCAFLFTLRNIAIVLWFNLVPEIRHADMLAFVVIAVLSGIAPFIVAGAGAYDAMSLFSPWGSRSAGLMVALPALLEALVVCFLALLAWRSGQKLRLSAA